MTNKLQLRVPAHAIFLAGAMAVPTAAFSQGATAAPDPATEAPKDSGAELVDVIVVSGFRASLNAAVAQKLASNSQVDVIVAEDIAKFPDTNLAESLQRIPGVAIQRDAGEGRAIVVRGLGSQFTRVRVNGMEAVATSTDGASTNRERGFDFNVFASELFTSLVVHKTAEPSLDEGSLGAVVDLNTGNPLALGAGFKLVTSVQGRYNDLSDDLGPRLAGLLGWVNESESFGLSLSAAYSQYETAELGNNSVRWQQAAFRSVGGTSCFTGSTYVPSAGCDEAALAFHPRIPRYGLVDHDRKRLGLTGSIQWAPSERTRLSIDGLYADFKGVRDEYWGEVLFRSNERTIDVADYTIDANNNLIAGTFNNAWVRTERYSRENETKFHQISANFKQDITDTLSFNLLGGASKSDASIPVETTIIFDDRDFMNYRYDYSNMETPQLTFGSSGIDQPTQFQLAEFRDRPSDTVNKFETFAGNIQWKFSDAFGLEAGGLYRKFTFDTVSYSRDSTYCAAFTCSPGQYGLAVTDSIADVFHLGDAGQSSGTTTSWAVPNLGPAADAVGLYSIPAVVREGDDRSVEEKVTGGYAQLNWDTDAIGIRMTGNLGARYVKTDQSSTGFVSGTEATVDRDYNDVLPSLNLNFFLTNDLVLRAAASKVLTRPSLGSLTPGGSVDQFNFRITSGNPFLDPYRAKAYDLALEWYFAPGAIASVAAFRKDIESFPLASSFTGTYAQSGLPTSLLTPGTPVYEAVVGGTNPNVPIEFRTNINGPGANLKGLEVALQLPFSTFTDGALSKFGVIGNLTLVQSDVDYTITGAAPAINASGNPTGGAPQVFTRPLIDLAKRSANGTVYYENDKFSARVSAAYRSGYLEGTSGNRNVFEGYDDILNVDASVRYKINDSVEFSLEGTNLTDEYRGRWVNDPSHRNYENNHFGRIIMLGARFSM